MIFTMKKLLLTIASLALLLAACGGDGVDSLTVYSGRSENLIAPLLEDFTAATGIEVGVKYGQSADLALLIDQEGDRSPADVFISQSPGATGFLAANGRLQPIADDVLEVVPARWRNDDGLWVGISGRVRVLVYNADLVAEGDLPTSIFELTDSKYESRVGVAPGNGSFQDFVTVLRDTYGDEAASEWLEGLAVNDAQSYAGNTAIVQAVGRGEIPMGLVNHYYNYRALAEDPGAVSRNHFFPGGDIGSLLIATAAGVLENSDDPELAARLVEYLLSEEAQRFLTEETFEYPLAVGIAPAGDLPALTTIDAAFSDLNELGGGLERTKELIDASGLESP
jgi:iron(III) transport system substrate-binding protein